MAALTPTRSSYTAVRAADELLMANASCSYYHEDAQSLVMHKIDGVPIPFASYEFFWPVPRWVALQLFNFVEKEPPPN